jgi:hypothetical protein
LLSHLNNCLNVGSIGSEFISSKRKQATEKYLKSKPKDSTGEKKEKESQEREKSGANMCRLKNHDHAGASAQTIQFQRMSQASHTQKSQQARDMQTISQRRHRR